MTETTGNAPKDCPDGLVCFYEDPEYTKLVRAEKPVVGNCVTLSAFTSVFNHSKETITVFDSDKGCWGDEKTVNANSGVSKLSFKSYSYKVQDD
ncbi:hypothetical protein GCM10009639_41030 [Kitasatospora putterlickiae]|uniref:Uncharacterized protein n=1 Tax=Kitasatospora putterlickiae TaxID=221725 RepID=A0ABN1Y7R9_9ACTN